MIAVCCKATIVIIRRSAIIDLIQALLKEPCKPRNKDEVTNTNEIRQIYQCISSVHYYICIYAKTVNIIFNQVLFVQFFSSILVLCTTVYYMSAHIMEFKGATFMVYTFCMFIQIYIYCWSGNEVILKSQNVGDAIYLMDWPLLSVSEKKDLLIIMIRGTIPIKFTSSFLITLSLQSYSNILKTSYSVFNLMQS
ncbi:odorant receptor Or2-like [Formica exsecta]|uniref:odorant receptor Or2-like n=1 Tax=Formica exsecta TaxID=72781 RepID=UPI0011412B25|nr:odorant receptor Or2-like [Formica exsecta]